MMSSLFSHVFFFLLISLVIALVSALIRLRRPDQIVRETFHFFITIACGVGLFCLLVYALEWIFIRPLV